MSTMPSCAGGAALSGWAGYLIHSRGAVLAAAAATSTATPRRQGLELAVEEGKTKAEAPERCAKTAQILRYYGAAGDRQAGEIFARHGPGSRSGDP